MSRRTYPIESGECPAEVVGRYAALLAERHGLRVVWLSSTEAVVTNEQHEAPEVVDVRLEDGTVVEWRVSG